MTGDPVLLELETRDEMMTVLQISEATGLHESTVRRHLNRLLADRRVKRSAKIYCSATGGYAVKWGVRP